MIAALEARKRKRLRRPKTTTGRFGTALGKLVAQKPWVVIITSVVFLGVLTAFASQLNTTEDLISTFPKTMQSRVGYDVIAAHFSSGQLAPVQVTIDQKGNPFI